ncbi:ABC transporter substrate-binding protein [Saliphagus sp. GCM10025334]
MGNNRRSFLKASGSLGVATIAGCVGGGDDGDTLKIGAPIPLSGPIAIFGQENERGYEFALEQLDNEILSNEVELIIEDTNAEPSTALERTRKLVQQDEVDALVGISDSAAGISVAEYIEEDAQIPHIVSQVGTVEARENPENCHSYQFFPWPSMRQQNLGVIEFIENDLAEAADEDIDTSRIHFVGEDYEGGQSALNIMNEIFNGEVTGNTMPPQGETDYSSYFPSIENADADLITGFIPGQAAVRFVNQAADYGLTEQKTLCMLGDTHSQIPLSQQGSSANGCFSSHWYDDTRDNELNNEFKEWYENNYDLPPNDIAVNGFNQLYSLGRAMEEAGSTDPDDVVGQLEGFTFGSPMGELTYRDSDHQTELNFVGFSVEDGQRNTIGNYDSIIGEAYCDV